MAKGQHPLEEIVIDLVVFFKCDQSRDDEHTEGTSVPKDVRKANCLGKR